MPVDLSAMLQDLAAKFAREIVFALRAASISDIMAETRGGPPAALKKRGRGRPRASAKAAPASPDRKAKRSPEALAADLGLIVKFVRSHPGSTGETIRKELGIARNQWTKSIATAVRAKALTKKGQKRSTKYWAA